MSRRRHTPEQIVRKLRGGREASERGSGAAGGRQASRGRGSDLSPLAQPIRWDEGRRCEAVKGARDVRIRG